MGCSVYAGIIVGWKFDDVCEIKKNVKTETVTRYNEKTGAPYYKSVDEVTYELLAFGETVHYFEESPDSYEVYESLEHFLKGKGVEATEPDEGVSSILIGKSIAQTGDLMYRSEEKVVNSREIIDSLTELVLLYPNPSVILSGRVSC